MVLQLKTVLTQKIMAQMTQK